MGRVRVREHVNPLAQKYQVPIDPPDWNKIYAKVHQPLHLDLGCGRGRLLWNLAQIEPSWNYLGLEIREPLVEEANQWRDEQGLTNLHYLFCNANNSLKPILETLPAGILKRVSIQFPDPWFKRRHQRRRIVQPELVTEIADYIMMGGEVFLQSDVKDVIKQMSDIFSENPSFQRLTKDFGAENPLPLPSERERSTISRGEPVYRVLFERC
ncbi:tRNA (guanosine(46)-N7)-methyltransferase TrmB [Capilliphycus salinus ALCB114379]|uniref:tRNA (guanosine(46)-N7)-methyltransferase TrmB n=1 Tax=Capilliphycus salinus TaxID=2768948 RepID=UPI0039A58040